MLVGEVGTGKTTLLRRALDSFTPGRVHTSFLFNPRLDVLDFLEFVLADFGIAPTPGLPARTKAAMLIERNRCLIERFRQQETCVIVVDEAQNLSADLLEEIRLLTNLETSTEKLLQIVLSGQPEFEDKLRRPELRQLRQRVSLWCLLHPLAAGQTGEYIAQRLLIAGTANTIFTPEAVQLIHRASRGIPRVINLICEHALIVGYADQLRRIGPDIIQSVAAELELEPQVPAADAPPEREEART